MAFVVSPEGSSCSRGDLAVGATLGGGSDCVPTKVGLRGDLPLTVLGYGLVALVIFIGCREVIRRALVDPVLVVGQAGCRCQGLASTLVPAKAGQTRGGASPTGCMLAGKAAQGRRGRLAAVPGLGRVASEARLPGAVGSGGFGGITAGKG